MYYRTSLTSSSFFLNYLDMVFDNQRREPYILCDGQIKLTHGLHVDRLKSVTLLSINLGRDCCLCFNMTETVLLIFFHSICIVSVKINNTNVWE